MKKLFLLIIFFASFGTAKAQTDSLVNDKLKEVVDLTGQNELKINLLGVAFGMPELSYERILNGKRGIGISIFATTAPEFDYDFGFIPYYRWYLGKPNAKRLFIEGNMAFISGQGAVYSKNGSSFVTKDLLGVGLGGAVGIKIIQKKSLVLDIYLGAGKALGAVKSFRKYERIGLTMGKRF